MPTVVAPPAHGARVRSRHSERVTQPITIREATDADLAPAADICVAAYDAAGQLEPGSPYVADLRATAARARDGILLIAEREGRIVGTATICPPGSAFREVARDGEVEFRFLAVDPQAQGTGVAAALIRAVEQHARDTGCSRLAICVRDTNTGAAAMYERMGFQREPSRDWTPRAGIDLLALTRGVPDA